MTRPRLPRLGERARLTALYGGLLVLCGILLTALVYVLVREGLYTTIDHAITKGVPATSRDASTPPIPTPSASSLISGRDYVVARNPAASSAEDAALSRLLLVSLSVLAAYALASVALAWWMAGRVLRPLGAITATARRLSAGNLHERIDLTAPPGELKDLADTFDTMLDRIEHMMGAQRRFAANAAHELRTPVTVQRIAAEVGLADDPDPERIAHIRDKLIRTADNSERLIDGLLLLAAGDRGLQRHDPVDLATTATTVAASLTAEAEHAQVTIEVSAQPLTTQGDPVLLEHLVRNLIANAIHYNHPGGHVHVHVAADRIEVTNTGPVIDPETVPRLFEPFHREQERRHAPGEGAGLGLAIVASIARAHHTDIEATANPDGGLTIRVTGW